MQRNEQETDREGAGMFQPVSSELRCLKKYSIFARSNETWYALVATVTGTSRTVTCNLVRVYVCHDASPQRFDRRSLVKNEAPMGSGGLGGSFFP